MRRHGQLLSETETIEILTRGTFGVLAVSGDDSYPYTVPLSYVYRDGRIYFHCAKEGHKLDGIRRNEKVTFCVIDRDDVIQETFTTHFQSATVFGKARILENDAEKRVAIEALIERYSPNFIPEGQKEIEKSWNSTCMVEIKIEHMTGKAAKEIIHIKNNK